MRRSLLLAFITSCVFLMTGTAVFPKIIPWYFSPFLATLFYKTSLKKAVWGSFAAGLITDLCCAQFFFGLFSLCHVVTCFLLHGRRKDFFEDRAVPFSLYTALISSALSLTLLLFSTGKENSLPLTPFLFLSECVIMPFVDAVYAFLGFTVPAFVYGYLRKHLFARQILQEEEE